MIGYKVFGVNMRATKFDSKYIKFKTNQIYSMSKSSLILYVNGFHFFKNIENIGVYYSYDTLVNRIFEVDITGDIIGGDYMSCTNEIKLIRELEQEEIDEYLNENLSRIIKTNNREIKVSLIEKGYCIDIFKDDKDWFVRANIAARGFFLNQYIKDKDIKVRKASALKMKINYDIGKKMFSHWNILCQNCNPVSWVKCINENNDFCLYCNLSVCTHFLNDK